MKTRLVVVDTETGGLDASVHALLSIGAYDMTTKETWHMRVRANGKVDQVAIKVNGLIDYDSLDLFTEDYVIGLFLDWLRPRTPYLLAGCNIPFDVAFLTAAMKRNGHNETLGHRFYDLQTLAFTGHLLGVIRLENESLSLNKIAASMDLYRTGDIHNALEDATLTAECIKEILSRLERKED